MKRYLVLSVDSTDEHQEGILYVDSNHESLEDAKIYYEASPFSNKYLVQILRQEENL